MAAIRKIDKQIHLQTPYDDVIETGTFIDIDDRGEVVEVTLTLEDALRLVKVVEAETRELS